MVATIPPEIPDWFWDLLDSSRPSLQELVFRLEALPRDQLIEYASTYVRAAEELCDYWAGPVVNGIEFSEDDTEDLCRWIVSQGPGLYAQALALQGNLEPLVSRYWASERGEDPEYAMWSTDVQNAAYRGYQSPAGIPHPIFEARFGSALQNELE
jgi:hypothetical protein